MKAKEEKTETELWVNVCVCVVWLYGSVYADPSNAWWYGALVKGQSLPISQNSQKTNTRQRFLSYSRIIAKKSLLMHWKKKEMKDVAWGTYKHTSFRKNEMSYFDKTWSPLTLSLLCKKKSTLKPNFVHICTDICESLYMC